MPILQPATVEYDMDLDELLQEMGQFGKFQIINYLLLSLPIFFSSIFTLTYAFTAGEVHHRCLVPECEPTDATYFPVPTWVENATGMEEVGGEQLPRRCLRFRQVANYTPTINDTCPSELFSKEEYSCDSWLFDHEENTIGSEWGLVCTDAWKLGMVGTINNVGQFIGLPIAGIFSDRYGRKLTLVVSSVLSGVIGLCRSFMPNYLSFLFFEFWEPLMGVGMYTAAFVLCMELVGPERRVLGGMLVCVSYAFGEAALGAIAWGLRDWRLILRVIYAPAILLGSYYWFVPESVRWLMIRGRKDDARVILKKTADMNGVDLPEDLLNLFLDGEPAGKESGVKANKTSPNSPKGSPRTTFVSGLEPIQETSQEPLPESSSPQILEPNASHILMQVLRSRVLVMRLVTCSFCWLSNTFVYYGLSLFSVAIGGNKYLNFILVSLIELPAYGAMYYFTDRFGRRTTLSVSLVLSGLCCVAFLFIQTDEEWLRLVPYMAGKFSITISFSVLYVFTAELFPTQLRHSLLGVCSMFGRMGSVVAPQTPLLATYETSLPVIMFAAMSFLSGIVAMFFPETMNMKLPDTVLEAEELSKKVNN